MADRQPNPTISVVTPTYNQAGYLEDTLTSVVDQGYTGLQYIVIDGGSDDRSVEIIRRYESRLSFWSSEPDTGHANALNKGFAQATGEIMAWLNSDDMYLPWTFSLVAHIFGSHPEVQWISGLSAFWDDAGCQVRVEPRFMNIYDYLHGNYRWIQQESTFFRRGLWDRAGGRVSEAYSLMVDGELWSRFFELEPLWHVQAVLGGFRSHGQNRSSAQRVRCTQEMDDIVARLKQRLPSGKVRTAKSLARARRIGRMWGKTRIPIDANRILRALLRPAFAAARYKTLAFDLRSNSWMKGGRSWPA